MTIYKCIECPFQGVVEGATADTWTCPKCGRYYEMQRPSPAVADHPDIPALVAELMAAESHSRCVWRGRDTRCGLCAGCVNADLLKRSRRALSNLTRALAERDALLAAREAQKPPAVAPTTTAYPPIVVCYGYTVVYPSDYLKIRG